MIYFNKILPVIFSPLGLSIFLLIYGILRKKRLPLVIASILVIVFSLPLVSNKLTQLLEQNYEPVDPYDVEKADAIVVLSGMVRTISKNNETFYEFSDAVDRILAGVELLKLNKAQNIILTRGNLPWNAGIPEGEFLAVFVKSQGVVENQIILTENVQNTNDEAKAVSKLLPQNSKIILVTSAFHMPRAITVFENQNLIVIPYAVDFRFSENKLNYLDLLPQAEAF